MGLRSTEDRLMTKREVLASWIIQHRTLVSIMLLNVLVAATGFGKDVAIAAYLGTTRAADAFSASYAVIDSVGSNALGNAANVATAAKLGEASGLLSRELYLRVAWRSIRLVAAVGGVLAVLMFFLRTPLLGLYANNHSQLLNMGSVYLWLLPLIFLHPVFYAIAGVLQSVRRFGASAFAPAVLNVGTIATSVWIILHNVNRSRGDVVIAASISVGAAAMVVIVVLAWRSWKIRREIPWISTNIIDFPINKLYTDLVSIMTVYALYVGLTQGIGMAERYAANQLSLGSLAAVTYAYRVAQVPNWVFVAAIGTFLIPNITAAEKSGEVDKLQQTLRKAVGICVILSLPVAIVFAVLRTPIIRVLFQRGAFSQHSVELTATFLGGYAFALVFQGLSTLLFRFTVALGRYVLPVLIVAGTYTANAVIDIAFTPRFGPLTIGLGAAGAAGICTTYLMFELHRRTGVMWVIQPRALFRYLAGNVFVLVVALGGAVAFGWIGLDSETQSILLLLVLCAMMATGYIVILLYGRVRGTDF